MAQEEQIDSKERERRKRRAVVTAFTVEIGCPHCGEPQPSPTGSHFWEIAEWREAAKARGPRTCNACDVPFFLDFNNKVTVPL